MADLPMLNEHEAPKRDKETGPIYQPTDDEAKVVKCVMERFRKAKKHRDQYDKKWIEYYKMFRGKQWPDYRPAWRHSDVINLIFQAVQSMAPLETDSRPRFTFVPTEPTDVRFAELLNQVAEADWERYNWLLPLTEVIFDKYFYGTGISSMHFDHDADFGAGEIKYRSEDVFWCYPDPDSRDVNVESEAFIHAEPMEVCKAKKKWSDKADFIRADAFDMYGGEKTDIGPVKTKASIDMKSVVEGGSPAEQKQRDEVLIITAWMKSDEYDELEEDDKDESGNPILDQFGNPQKKYIQKLRYPNGCKCVVANGVLLECGPNPYDDGEFPFSRLQNYILPREFWGISEIEQLDGPQKVFNKLVCFALDVLTLMGNPVWVVDTTAGIDTDNLFNRPGDVVEKEPGSEVRREAGVQLQPFVLSFVDRMKVWFDQISGANDVTRGVNPTGVTAASAIESLQEAAQTRTRQKMRLMDCYLKTVGQQYASRVMQFYSVPRVFRLTGADGLDKFFKFSVETADRPDGTQTKVAKIVPYKDDMGSWVEDTPREYELRGKLDVRASTGSGLPFAKAEKEKRLMSLFQLGIIDAEEVLKGMDYPNAEMVLSRMKANQTPAMPAPAQGGA